jgi:hypothetical protein
MFYREPDWEEEHKFYAKHDFVWTAKQVTPIPGGDKMMEVTAEADGVKSTFQMPKKLFFRFFYCFDVCADGSYKHNLPKPQVLVDKDFYEALNFVFNKLHTAHTPWDGPIS